MKHKGCLMEYASMRADDLMRAYDEYISSCKYIRMPQLYKTIVNMPASRFFVSDKRADTVISAILRGENVLDNMLPLKKEMYQEILRRVQILQRNLPHLSVARLCAIVVAQPAPKFYLTPGTAKTMVCKARKDWIKRKKRNFLKRQSDE